MIQLLTAASEAQAIKQNSQAANVQLDPLSHPHTVQMQTPNYQQKSILNYNTRPGSLDSGAIIDDITE